MADGDAQTPPPATSTTTSTTTTHGYSSPTTTAFDHEAYYKSLSPSEGQTWVIISVGVIPCVVFLLCVVLIVRYKWKRDADPRPNAPAACTSCQLIEMGEMVCLGDKCPKCGRPQADMGP